MRGTLSGYGSGFWSESNRMHSLAHPVQAEIAVLRLNKLCATQSTVRRKLFCCWLRKVENIATLVFLPCVTNTRYARENIHITLLGAHDRRVT